jgi:hypothetical protein
MWSFLSKSGPSLLLVATLAIGGYFVLAPPAATSAQPAAIELANHAAGCTVCRLAPYGGDGQASRFGPPPAADSVTSDSSF